MKTIKLPQPILDSKISLEKIISLRRSIRNFKPEKILSLQDISNLLWSAYGITDILHGFHSVPSAGATFPMEIYIITNEYFAHYLPEKHSLQVLKEKDLRNELAVACWEQNFIADASISVIICAVYERTTSYYGKRGIRYVDMEAGHIAQNLHLQAVALGLGSVPIGAFNDNAIKKLLDLPNEQVPIYIVSIGYPKM